VIGRSPRKTCGPTTDEARNARHHDEPAVTASGDPRGSWHPQCGTIARFGWNERSLSAIDKDHFEPSSGGVRLGFDWFVYQRRADDFRVDALDDLDGVLLATFELHQDAPKIPCHPEGARGIRRHGHDGDAASGNRRPGGDPRMAGRVL
jgi:hypothetical protein